MKSRSISLLELQQKIKILVGNSFPSTFWLIAEVGQVQISHAGHCYLQLIEKDKNEIVAKMQANIWENTFRLIKPYFETTTGIQLQSGVKILIRVNIVYDAVYGISLSVIDIEPSYTRGEIEIQRQIIYRKLKEEGVAHMNKNIPLPIIPKNIAIISSSKAAGYEDFINELKHNPYNFTFHSCLFNATMQGKKTTETILIALDKILRYERLFDVLVIIRGGGDETDISSFDSYELASHIAQFPLPVICAIGHERDQTVLDLVASVSLKTPTAAADFLIQKFITQRDNFFVYCNRIEQLSSYFFDKKNKILQEISFQSFPFIVNLLYHKNLYFYKKIESLKTIMKQYLYTKNHTLVEYNKHLRHTTQQDFEKNKQIVNKQHLKLNNYINTAIHTQKMKLDLQYKINQSINPKNILKKGFSISFANNKPIKNGEKLKAGTIIKTKFHIGQRNSKIVEIRP